MTKSDIAEHCREAAIVYDELAAVTRVSAHSPANQPSADLMQYALVKFYTDRAAALRAAATVVDFYSGPDAGSS